MIRRRALQIAIVLPALLLAPRVARTHSPRPTCPPARFVLAPGQERSVVTGSTPQLPDAVIVDVAPRFALSGCDPVAARVRPRKTRTLITARWARCGNLRRVRATGTLPYPACSRMEVRVTARRTPPSTLLFVPSTCGDGVLDPGNGESCDASASAGDAACPGRCSTAGPDRCLCVTTSTTTSSSTTSTLLSTSTTVATTSTSTSSITSTSTTTSTTLPVVCGDFIVAGDEECDDGGTVAGDGCSPDCRLECPLDLTGTWGTPFFASLDPLVLLRESPAGSIQGTKLRPELPGFAEPITGTRAGTAVSLQIGDLHLTGSLVACDHLHFLDQSFDLSDLGRISHAVCGDGVLQDGEVCDDGNFQNGDDCNAACAAPACGNALVEPGEDCDDGNAVDDDLCANDCRRICGNGILEPGESCDDGNRTDGDGCSATCEVECPDGVAGTWATSESNPPVTLNLDEAPDGTLAGVEYLGDRDHPLFFIGPFPFAGRRDGPRILSSAGLFAVRTACDRLSFGRTQLVRISTAVCGNGILEPGETCDDGNLQNGDQCSVACRPPTCGNFALEPGEECDDGNLDDDDGCTAQCRVQVCGNGILEAGELCDDGNSDNGDGCSDVCRPQNCGDGTLDSGEDCDDGNRVDGDGCSSRCEADCTGVDGLTGTWRGRAQGRDFVLRITDTDFGLPFDMLSGSAYLADDPASFRSLSGSVDGSRPPASVRISAGELSGDGRWASCGRMVLRGVFDPLSARPVEVVRTSAAVCGNGRVEADEACDDGNFSAGDGCDPTCRVVCAELPCDDQNACTTDSCDPSGGCTHVAIPGCRACTSNGACYDANPCTVDTCDGGTCHYSAVPDGTACADSDLCDGTETCIGGTCVAGTPADCDDGIACTDDSCNPDLGCVHRAAPPGSSCCFHDVGDGTVYDRCTGLQWELKTRRAPGVPADLHDVEARYQWAGTCAGSSLLCQLTAGAEAACRARVPDEFWAAAGCNRCPSGACVVPGAKPMTVWDWLSELNAANFAGYSDWRLPSAGGLPGQPVGLEELGTIVNMAFGPPRIEPIFGPTASSAYWSSQSDEFPDYITDAFVVDFSVGAEFTADKGFIHYVRAVR